MENELREWLDRLAIQDLIYRYSNAVTRADWSQCEAVFAPDATWECPQLGMRYDSPEAFLQTLRETTSYDFLIQTPHSPVIQFTDSDHAQATTTIHEINRGVSEFASALGERGAEINIETYGIYYDDIARIDGQWKFTHRKFVPFFLESGGVRADVLTPRSELSTGME